MPTKYIGYITQPEVYEVPAITLYYIILYFYKHYISISQSEQNFLIQFPRYAAVTENPLEKKRQNENGGAKISTFDWLIHGMIT